MGPEAEVDQALAWTEKMAQYFWTLTFLLGLMKIELDLFHGRMDGEETPGTWGQSFISTAINFTTTPYPLLYVFPQNRGVVFLLLLFVFVLFLFVCFFTIL